MALQFGDIVPDLEAETTECTLRLPNWLGSSWGAPLSHPKDFTPVCTTELGEVARLKPEFDKRDAKVIALSVDPLADHRAWAGDIAEILRAIDSLQLTATHSVAAPFNWQEGEDIIMAPSISDAEAAKKPPSGSKTLKPCLRVVAQSGRTHGQ